MSKKYDIHWLRLAFSTASRFSQDANSQTGAMIVEPETNLMLSSGANRMHFGLKGRFEGKGERIILGRPKKYTDLIHAERDAIYTANRNGISLVGATIYATWTPCVPCAELILNNGIIRFVTHESTDRWYRQARQDESQRNNWTESIEKAVKLLERGNVSYEIIKHPLGGVEFMFDDVVRQP